MRRAIVAVLLVAANTVHAQPGNTPVDAPGLPPTPPELTPDDAAAVIARAEASPVQAVTFDQAVALALAHSADARIAADEVIRADALLQESASTLRPLIGVEAQYQQLEGRNRLVDDEQRRRQQKKAYFF